jgi:RNA polymerase sigma-B factor
VTTAEGCSCRWSGCHESFATLAATPDATARIDIRNSLAERHLSLARAIARRYTRYGVPFDDLAQVAALALVQAVDRFDHGREIPFSSFAAPTVAGSMKHYLRDHAWAIRVPRQLKERFLELSAALDSLTQQLGRDVSTLDLATQLRYNEQDVQEALQAAAGLRPASLDAPSPGGDGDETTLGSLMGADDAAYGQVEIRESLRPLLAALPSQERRAVRMRFFASMTQDQIAKHLGCSQVQVSRLLRAALARLRSGLLEDTPATPDAHDLGRRRPALELGRI